MQCGEIVDLLVTKMSGYGCWGTADGKTGFLHCVGWSEEKPVPARLVPVVGQRVKVRIFFVPHPNQPIPSDASFGGTIRVDFAAAPALVDEGRWQAYLTARKSD